MPEGVVKSFDIELGFGFITPVGGGKDVFVHISAIENSGLDMLIKGEKVSYELVPGREGFEAAVELKVIALKPR